MLRNIGTELGEKKNYPRIERKGFGNTVSLRRLY